MKLSATINLENGVYTAIMLDRAEKNRKALLGAAEDARDEILARGAVDIASAGNFGKRWTEGLKGSIVQSDDSVQLDITHDEPHFRVFENGAIIKGKPLLWIPLSFATDAIGKYARNFPGGLFRVDRKRGGAPLLLSIRDKRPKYFGKESVTIPKKFHIIEICRDVIKKINIFFSARLKANG